jgi:hypothetical protein
MTAYFKFGDITIKVPEKMIVDDKQGNPLLKDTLTKSGNLSSYLGHKSIQIKNVANLERIKIVTDQPAYKEYVKPAVKKRGRKPKPIPEPELEPELEPEPKINVSVAKKRIQTFMHRKRYKITSLFLNTICNNSGECFAFGNETTKIKAFFNNYNNFTYAIKSSEIGKGANGIVYKILYERLNYKSFNILKVSLKVNADNLFYEYITGLFINTYYKKLPCFLETRGLNRLITATYTGMSDLKNIPINDIEDVKNVLNETCLNPIKMTVLLEHIDNSNTLKKMLLDADFLKNDCVLMLFIIYFSLNQIKGLFTHYDLHDENILLFKPVTNKYIEYNFIIDNKSYKFKSPYMVKIIDYGRCYFNNEKLGFTSMDFLNLLKKDKDCKRLKYNAGYGWVFNKGSVSSYFIEPSKNNQSIDLRILKMISEKITPIISNNLFMNPDLPTYINNKIKSLFTTLTFTSSYGTKSILKSGVTQNKINNITDAYNSLLYIIKNQEFINMNSIYYEIGGVYESYKKVGMLTIYNDGSSIKYEHV